MSKGKEHEEEAEENSERWLLTYADMITLLLALFIIMYSMSNVEVKKFQEIAKQFSSAFHAQPAAGPGTGATGDGIGMGDQMGIGDGTGTGEQAQADGGEGSSGGAPLEDPLDEIYNSLSQYVKDNALGDQITLENADSFVRIRIQGVLMFYPDSPRLLESSQSIIKVIAEAIIKIYDRVDHITISGHTATTGENTDQNNAFAWSLSINRADTVRESLVEYGVKEAKLSLEGYGHNVPVSPNSTEAGRAKNRRAEITVYKTSSDSQTQ